MERLISRISYQSANPRDLIAFKSSISMIPPHIHISAGQLSVSADAVSFTTDLDDAGRTSAASIDRAIHG